MTTTDISSLLEDFYKKAMETASGKETVTSLLDNNIRKSLDIILLKAESQKGVCTVVFTSVAYKIIHQEQDIRKHQTSIPGGYSGRSFDTAYITPFLKSKQFPSMEESGWLTRSLEQKVPYDRNYTGAIKEPLKSAFLEVLEAVQVGKVDPSAVLDYMMQGLIIQRDTKNIDLARPKNLSINEIVNLLDEHFHHKYSARGAARLPVLALYATYQCLMDECKRFENKKLLPLESHTSADAQSGRMGDIDVVNTDNTPFEAVEVKFDIPISYNIVETAKGKIIRSNSISRYYILSTKELVETDIDKIDGTIKQVKNVHNCQLVVNGVMPSLKYYLRLLDNLKSFIEKYTILLDNDKSIMFEHKKVWNDLVAKL